MSRRGGKLGTLCCSRVEQRRQETRRRILEVAEQMFIREDSYEQTTIRELARRADVSVGAVYLHFKTKADILAALVVQFIDGMCITYASMVTGNTTGARRLEALLSYLDMLRNDSTFKLYFQFSHLNKALVVDERLSYRIHQEMMNFRSHVESLIREGVADGTVHYRGDPSLAALTLIAMSFSLIGSLFTSPDTSKMAEIYNYTADEIFSCFQGFIRETFHTNALIS